MVSESERGTKSRREEAETEVLMERESVRERESNPQTGMVRSHVPLLRPSETKQINNFF